MKMFQKKLLILMIAALLTTQTNGYADIKLTGKDKPYAVLESRADLEKINQALRDADDRYFDFYFFRIDKPMALFVLGLAIGLKL